MIRAAAIALTLAAAPALAGTEGYGLIFRTGTLDAVATGATLSYAHSLTDLALPQDQGGTGPEPRVSSIALARPDGSRVLLTETGATGSRTLADLKTTVGNPLAMFFLETTALGVSRATGGSPFYIRNRLKDALVGPDDIRDVTVRLGGRDVPAREIRLTPFAQDKERGRLGAFADLVITVTVSDEVPGWYHALSARAPATGDAVYADTITAEPAQ